METSAEVLRGHFSELLSSLEIEQPDAGDNAETSIKVTLGAGADGSNRGLIATHSIPPGEVAAALPVRCARTVSTCTARLQAAPKGSLGPGLEDMDVALSRCAGLLPGDTRRVLLLALALLLDLRDPATARRPALRLLPAPPGSPLARLCSAGVPATDLQLFSAQELQELQCPPLEASIMRERLRMTALHGMLFPGPEPTVSLHSFFWAHCLVRSRGLSLRLPEPAAPASGDGADSKGDGKGGGSLRQLDLCMLPLISMANHRGGGGATCTVRLSVKSGGNSTIQLVATRLIEAGEEVFISYGDRPLRDFLRGYAFTPTEPAQGFEVFEDFGGPQEALIVQYGSAAARDSAAAGASSVQAPEGAQAPPPAAHQAAAQPAAAGASLLQEVHVLSQPGGHSLLDFDGASVCYTVSSASRHGGQYGPEVVRQDDCSGSAAAEEAEHPAEAPPSRLDGEVEAGVCRHVAGEAHALLQRQATSIEQDEELLRSNPEPPAEDARAWNSWMHVRLAVQYRLARKRLLRQVGVDLEGQAHMVDGV